MAQKTSPKPFSLYDFYSTREYLLWHGKKFNSRYLALTSCLTSLDSTKQVNLLSIWSNTCYWTSQTGGLTYTDTSPYKVSDYFTTTSPKNTKCSGFFDEKIRFSFHSVHNKLTSFDRGRWSWASNRQTSKTPIITPSGNHPHHHHHRILLRNKQK